MSAYTNDMDSISVNFTKDPKAKDMDSKICFHMRSPTKYYYGREIELQKLQKLWKDSIKSKDMFFVAITGLGGIGKSELAKYYAKQFYENNDGHCIWIDAETEETLRTSFQTLAENDLKISLKDNQGKKRRLDDLVKEIFDPLTDKKCLIILDNVETYDSKIFRLLSDLTSIQPPTAMKPFVIITSRLKPAKEFFENHCFAFHLNVLTEDSSTKFFLKSFDLREDTETSIREVIGKLCFRLQYYPLAMQQSLAFINEKLSKKTDVLGLEKEVVNYMAEIDKESKKLLNHKLPLHQELDGVSNTTYLTWKVTMEKITKTPVIGNVAAKMMKIISFLSPDNISTDLLWKIFGRLENPQALTDVESQDCFQILADHSMIDLYDNHVSIHRLVQEVIRIELMEMGELTTFLDEMMKCIQEMLKANVIPVNQMIHVESIWQHATIISLIEKYRELPSLICFKFYNSGKYRNSYDFSRKSVGALISLLGEDSRWVLQVKFCEGRALKGLGDYSESLEMLKEVYNKQTEIFGKEDDDCLITANGIGSVYWRIKEFEDAMGWYQHCLEERQKKSGNEHPQAIEFMNNIASVLDYQGKYKEANEMYQQVMQIAERVLGKEHLETLITKHNLAVVWFHQGEYKDALDIFKQVFEVRERVLESDHPHTLITSHWIADTYKSLGNNEKARQLAKSVLAKRVETLGPNHPDTNMSKCLVDSLDEN